MAFVFLASRLRGSETSILISVGVIVLIVGGLFLLVTKSETVKPWFARALHRVPRVDKERASSVSETVVGSIAKVGSPERLIVALLISLAAWISALLFYDLILEAFSARVGAAEHSGGVSSPGSRASGSSLHGWHLPRVANRSAGRTKTNGRRNSDRLRGPSACHSIGRVADYWVLGA